MMQTQRRPRHPVSFGALGVDGKPTDIILTDPNERGCQAFVDYIFLSPSQRVSRCEATVEMDTFACDPASVGACQVSDHYVSGSLALLPLCCP